MKVYFIEHQKTVHVADMMRSPTAGELILIEGDFYECTKVCRDMDYGIVHIKVEKTSCNWVKRPAEMMRGH